MNILVIDTSTDTCSVVLASGALPTPTLRVDHRLAPRQQARLLLPMIDALMGDAGLAPGDLDGVVFGRGPGSFTGLRIAAATAQGIALGADAGVLGVSGLQAIAQGCYRKFGDTAVDVALDARLGGLYRGWYALDADRLMQPVIDEALVPPTAVDAEGTWVHAGSGAERYAETLISASERQRGQPWSLRRDRWPHARDLLTLALPRIQSGQWQPPEDAVPVYLRNKVALTASERASGEQLN